MRNKSTYNNYGFPYDCRLRVSRGNGFANKSLTFNKWVEKVVLCAKSFSPKFYQVFEMDFEAIPDKWINIKAYSTAEDEELAKADELGILSIILEANIQNGLSTIKDWESAKPELVAFMLNAMSDDAIKRVEERDRDAWKKLKEANDILGLKELIRKSQLESGKATLSLSDKDDAREACNDDVRLQPVDGFEDIIVDNLCETNNSDSSTDIDSDDEYKVKVLSSGNIDTMTDDECDDVITSNMNLTEECYTQDNYAIRDSVSDNIDKFYADTLMRNKDQVINANAITASATYTNDEFYADTLMRNKDQVIDANAIIASATYTTNETYADAVILNKDQVIDAHAITASATYINKINETYADAVDATDQVINAYAMKASANILCIPYDNNAYAIITANATYAQDTDDSNITRNNIENSIEECYVKDSYAYATNEDSYAYATTDDNEANAPYIVLYNQDMNEPMQVVLDDVRESKVILPYVVDDTKGYSDERVNNSLVNPNDFPIAGSYAYEDNNADMKYIDDRVMLCYLEPPRDSKFTKKKFDYIKVYEEVSSAVPPDKKYMQNSDVMYMDTNVYSVRVVNAT